MSNEIRVYGPPGTGKTQKLATEIVPTLAAKYGPDKIMLTSLTRAAAAELGARINLGDSDIVGTLHSICFRALKLSRDNVTEQHFADWNKSHALYDLSGSNKDLGPRCYSQYQLLKNKMIHRDQWPADVTAFADAWEKWKSDNMYYDYVDFIEMAGGLYSPPGSPYAIVLDEAQDFTKLEMSTLRRWATQVKEFWVTGDEDQCSKKGTMVETVDGKKPIEQLNPETDRLKVYSKGDAMIYGGRSRRYKFKIANRQYTGLMHKVSCGNKSTECTSNHKWYVKWNPELRHTKWYVVYLMRQGTRYRVGRCQLFRNENSANRPNTFHPCVRMRLENAEDLWILKVFDDKAMASAYESYISAEYGLPLILFTAEARNCLYTKETIDWVFTNLSDQWLRVVKVLQDHNLDIKYPFYSNKIANKHALGRSIMKMEAINIAKISETDAFLMAPTKPDKGRYVKWEPISVSTRNAFNETVYSLDVEKYHTYIADGICTCNCLYPFSGADPKNMLLPELPPEQIIILDQSYRIPKTVHDLAQKIIGRVKTRMPKEYKPREEEGSVTFCQGGYKQPEWVVKKAQELEGNSMILTTCDYMLQDIIAYMRSTGIAFSNPWKPDQKSWNPLETKANNLLRSFLSCGKDEPYWDTAQLLGWIENLKTGKTGLIRKQGKAGIKQISEYFEKDPFAEGLYTCREYLDQILSPDAIQPALNRDVDWLIENVTKAKATTLKFPLRIFKSQGKEALFKEPKIHVGTVHSVKGAGAENVFIYPDISGAAAAETNTKEGRENLCRLFYVGITRTKKNLFVMSKSSKYAFSL